MLDETVRLRPLVALVRFTLLGGAAETVTKVTLSGSAPLSGSIVFYDAETLQSAFYDTPGAEANPSNYIQMDGRFSSGGVYYAAAVPGASDMTVLVTLEDAAGHQHTIPVEHVSLRAGDITDLGTLYLGPSLVESGDLFPIMTATRGPKPIVLMFVPDGFVDGTGANSREEYVKACREGAAYIFNVEPFKSNRDRFTVYVAWKAAAEAGVGTTFGAELGVWYENYLGLRAQARQDICDFAEAICPEIREGVTEPRDMGIFLLVNGRKNYGAVCEWSEPESRNEGRFIAVLDYTGAYQYGSMPVGVIPAQWGGNTSTGPEQYHAQHEHHQRHDHGKQVVAIGIAGHAQVGGAEQLDDGGDGVEHVGRQQLGIPGKLEEHAAARRRRTRHRTPAGRVLVQHHGLYRQRGARPDDDPAPRPQPDDHAGERAVEGPPGDAGGADGPGSALRPHRQLPGRLCQVLQRHMAA